MTEAETELPKAIIRRIVKNQLDRLSGRADDEKKGNFQITADALLAFSESAKIFISYLTATANDICKEKKRQTISADDIFSALDDLDFNQFVEPLQEALAGFRQEHQEKRSAAQKRKQMEPAEGKTGQSEHEEEEGEGAAEGEGGEDAGEGEVEGEEEGDEEMDEEDEEEEEEEPQGPPAKQAKGDDGGKEEDDE